MADYIVHYGEMRFLGVFTAPAGQEFARSTPVIVRTERGLESGEVLTAATPEVVARLADPPTGQILRAMTPEDLHEQARMKKHAREELDVCQKYVDQLALNMQLVEVEHIFGGERIIVYYLAENRVDFRELVKLLAGQFQTRIEMRQIGVRDEAKLLADYGDCGCPVCCNTHLVEMPPVSMRMAKLQKATLDPTKISGRCGRLKCCLRYEFDYYEELQREFPPVGAFVMTPEGKAKVLGHEIFNRQLQVLTEDRRRLLVPVEKASPLGADKGAGEGFPAASEEEPPAGPGDQE
ncbi:MAG: signal peptidase [Pirellulales bacterium]|nr:signal peptidase [Pirellulales bacterium]